MTSVQDKKQCVYTYLIYMFICIYTYKYKCTDIHTHICIFTLMSHLNKIKYDGHLCFFHFSSIPGYLIGNILWSKN